MPIARLNEATARLIGSSASITSPYAVVKELLDNAIDAGADAVEVAISPNTLDQIRVRDNGHGIALDDLDSLGRQAHTSKLGSFDELTSGQVQTLGFRGQALASINNIATVHVITKTTEEPVATKVLLASNYGGIEKKFAPVSAPTGTTILVSDLFSNMPPRKHFLLKEMKKTTTQIKELLTVYALANSDLRITFKVLGNEKQSCKFGRTKFRDMKQSVLEVFGATVAANGETHRFASTESENSRFTLLAFLPSVNGDQKATAGKGSFISVNGRPISSTTGIGKALTGVFKTKIQHSWQRRGLPTVQRPLLLLEILCSFADYDANVATMKDEVLFADSSVLLRTLEKLCGTVYDKTTVLEDYSPSAINGENNKMPLDGSMTPPMEKLVSVQMRTAFKANMLRTNSNATDDETDFQEMQVRVPARLHTETKDSRDGLRDVAPKSVRGIERYFLPTGADFEIATDDTATPELQQSRENSGEAQDVPKTLKRMPLNDVPDSTLNILAGIQGSPSDSSSQGDAPRLSDLHGMSWSIQSLLHQRALNIPSRGTTTSASPPLRRVPQTRGLPEDRRQVTQRAQLPAMIRTPPPSDPTREESRLVYDFDATGHGVRRQPASPASSSSNSAAVMETRPREHLEMPQRVTLPMRRSELHGTTRGVVASEMMPRLGRPPATRPRPQATTKERPLTRRRQEYEEPSDDATTPDRGWMRPNPVMSRSHSSRTHLLEADDVDAEMNDDESVADTTPPPQPKRQRRGAEAQNVGQRAKTPNPRCKTPKLLMTENLENLPLECIPASMATWCIILTRTDVCFADVRMWMDLGRDTDLYIDKGCLGSGLKNVGRGDAMELESRMRQICQV
ncbi:hypothetical protein LLEC1_05108 [Akanthomyces lecanii]|uniref:DNA mismatch repair protein S5 domain-containing protein n=1 Tax=Cordyceps confragosa TaxID=2714763 RepID=A0A179IA22_CORDF|nr:hypothetical protein LLEC1_05108 [Akanthomyces lecanii]